MKNFELFCNYACRDVTQAMIYPSPDLDPEKIKLAMISEAPSADERNYFYREISGSFFQTTRIAFEDAGYTVNCYDDITAMGIYLTTAIKCPKKDYLVSSRTLKNCAGLLEKELSRFPNITVILCMGDFAIKSVNYIYRKKLGIDPIRHGSTYRIREECHLAAGIRFFPSYTQTGNSFNLEKSKRHMIAEDIKSALLYLENN